MNKSWFEVFYDQDQLSVTNLCHSASSKTTDWMFMLSVYRTFSYRAVFNVCVDVCVCVCVCVDVCVVCVCVCVCVFSYIPRNTWAVSVVEVSRDISFCLVTPGDHQARITRLCVLQLVQVNEPKLTPCVISGPTTYLSVCVCVCIWCVCVCVCVCLVCVWCVCVCVCIWCVCFKITCMNALAHTYTDRTHTHRNTHTHTHTVVCALQCILCSVCLCSVNCIFNVCTCTVKICSVHVHL